MNIASAPALPAPFYIIGCDLGQVHDHTALTVLEGHAVDTGRTTPGHPAPIWYDARGRRCGGETTALKVWEHRYAVRHLERLPLGTTYPKQVSRILELFGQVQETSGTTPRLIVDVTGVGRPVVDMIASAGLYPYAATITGGDRVTQGESMLEVRIPKRDLVATAQVLLQVGRLKIASALSLAPTLTDEMTAFKVNINQRGHDTYGNDVSAWRENPHDDLVLATALACWLGEQG